MWWLKFYYWFAKKQEVFQIAFSAFPKFNHNLVKAFLRGTVFICVLYLTHYKNRTQRTQRNGFWYFIMIITL